VKSLASLLLAGTLCLPAAAAPADGEMEELVYSLETGIWNERVWAVNRLGERGLSSLPSLAKALDDLDWQVRLNAVQWIGRSGPGGASMLESALLRERCPLVRMAAVHWLGSFGRWDGKPGEPEDPQCRTWTWPMTKRYRKAKGRKSKASGWTAPDRVGCRYIRYRRRGSMSCPEGTVVKGVGSSPRSLEMLEGRPPESEVLLCCPPDAAAPVAPKQARTPEGVECRTLPTECPAPWVEMEPREGGLFKKKKPRKFRRTRRHKKGLTVWVHCCRPHGLTRPETETVDLPAPPAVAGTAVPFEPQERESIPEGFPEGEIARRRLDEEAEQEAVLAEFYEAPDELAREEAAPVETEDRMAELEYLLEFPTVEAPREPLGDPRDLPAPRGPEFRTEPPVRGEAVLMDASERPAPRAGIETAPGLAGGPERLGGGEGPGYRDKLRVQAPLEIVDDHGAPEPGYDALPALLKMLRHKSPRRRARAAEAVGALGPRAREAAGALKRALRDRSPRVRSNAALALGSVTQGTDFGVKALRRALRDQDPDVRYSAAAALGRIGTQGSSRVFTGHVRGAAAKILTGTPAGR